MKNKYHKISYWLKKESKDTPQILMAIIDKVKSKLEKTAKLWTKEKDRYKCYWCKAKCQHIIRAEGMLYLTCSEHLEPIQVYFLIKERLNAISTDNSSS